MEGRTGLRRTWSLSEGHIMHRCAAELRWHALLLLCWLMSSVGRKGVTW